MLAWPVSRMTSTRGWALLIALVDDSRRIVDRLKDAGGQATLDVWPDAPHVWQIFDGWIPEARDALTKAAFFAKKTLKIESQGES